MYNKNLNLFEANQLSFHKCGRRFEHGATAKHVKIVCRARLEPESAELRDRFLFHSARSPAQGSTLQGLSKDIVRLFSPEEPLQIVSSGN